MKELRNSNDPHTVVRKLFLTTFLTFSYLLISPANAEKSVVTDDSSTVIESITNASDDVLESTSSEVAVNKVNQISNQSSSESDKLSPPTAGERRKIGVSGSDVMQLFFGLFAVIIAIFAMAWLAKKLQIAGGGGNGKIALSGGISLGGKERLVIARVGNKEYLLGVTPHSINKLAELELTELESGDNHTVMDSGKDFSETLKNIISKGLSK